MPSSIQGLLDSSQMLQSSSWFFFNRSPSKINALEVVVLWLMAHCLHVLKAEIIATIDF